MVHFFFFLKSLVDDRPFGNISGKHVNELNSMKERYTVVYFGEDMVNTLLC